MGGRRTLFFLVSLWCLAWTCEYSSTNGYVFPFGEYHYIDTTSTRELWVANVPFWDSLSFVFLSYFSFMLAAAVLSPGADLRQSPWPGLRRRGTPVLGGLLMMLLDIVIDPLSLQGSKWFLGQVYGYPTPGFYFGVTLANFLGWFFVGWFGQLVFQWYLARDRRPWRTLPPQFHWGIFGVYAGVFGFNLFMTFWIGDYVLALTSSLIVLLTLGAVFANLKGALVS